MIFPGECASKLVHEAARHPRKVVLRSLAEQRFLYWIQRLAGNGFEQSRDGNLQSGTAGEAPSIRQRRIDDRVETMNPSAPVLKARDHAAHIIGPARVAALHVRPQVKLRRFT